MKRADLNNKTLDAIGATLVRRSAPRADEIENLIADPVLFEMVLKKIGSDRLDTIRTDTTPGMAAPFFNSNILKFAGATAVIVVALLSILSATLSRTATPLIAVLEVRSPEMVPVIARPVSPPKFSYELSPGRATFSDIGASEARRVVKAVYHPLRNSSPVEGDGPFYELSAGGDPYGALDNGRIVRVDIKRSSLLALGVNLPLENESETVRAELLVGTDGVTRAIRLVK